MTALLSVRRWAVLAALFVICTSLFLPPIAAQNAVAKAPKTAMDLILIIDTSETMVGKAGGQNIFPDVKRALKELVDACGSGSARTRLGGRFFLRGFDIGDGLLWTVAC